MEQHLQMNMKLLFISYYDGLFGATVNRLRFRNLSNVVQMQLKLRIPRFHSQCPFLFK